MCFWSRCLLNRASTWGAAGVDLLFAADVFLVRVLTISSAYMGNGWF